MSKRARVFSVMAILIAISFGLPCLRGNNGYVDVTVSEAENMINSNPLLVILDVRTQSEYDSGHIRNARLIPHTELEARIGELDEDREILVYCHSGVRSATASQILVDHGFSQVYNMLGGILAWISADYPVYTAYVHNASLQQIINNADEGDTIFISSGTYLEHIVINKSLTLIGENRNTTIIDGGSTGNVVLIKAVNNTAISDFTIRGSGCGCAVKSGIYIQDSYNISIAGSNITSNGYGLQLENSNSCRISSNIIADNEWPSIALDQSHRNVMTGNDMKGNALGISLKSSSDNVFFHNNIIDNTHQTEISGENANVWDDGYPSGGNYWSDYYGADSNGDGIGDTPYTIDEDNQDNYPLMNPYNSPEEMQLLLHNLLEEYNSLLTDYDILNSTFHSLELNYTRLQADYNNLSSTYNEIRSRQEATINDLNNIRNLMYIFTTTTVILLATTIYSIRRKSKL